MTPLVLVHGFMGGSGQWHLQAPIGETRPLVNVDLPGFGANVHLPPIDSIEDYGRWVLDDLTRREVRTFDLLGHSMGGMVVQEMVRLAPDSVSRLVLYGTGAVGTLPGRFESIETSMERARSDGPAATARRIAATWFLTGEAAPEYAACAAIAERTRLPAILAGLKAMEGWSGAEALERIRAPTLILWGDGDRTYPWSQTETLWRAIPNCNLAVVPNCAHAVHLENAEVFNRLIADFIEAC